MANLFHMDPDSGTVRPCEAPGNSCAFAAPEAHFATAEDARQAQRDGEIDLLDPAVQAYRVRQRRAALTQLDELEGEMERLLTDLRKEGIRRTSQDSASKTYMRSEWRKNLLDALEGRSGRRLAPEHILKVGSKSGTANQLAASLEPLAYEGTYLNHDSGEIEPAFLGVYEDGTGRAFERDLRRDDEYRHAVSRAKPEELQVLEARLAREAGESGVSDAGREAYVRAISLLSVIRDSTDWTDPLAGAEGLSRLTDLADNFEEKSWEDTSDSATYRRLSDELDQAAWDAYAMAGVQKMARGRTD